MLRRQWLLIVAVTAIAAGAAAVCAYVRTPVHRAEAKLLLSQGGTATSPAVTRTLENLVRSNVVAQNVVQDLQLKESAGRLLEKISVVADPGSAVLTIRVDDPSRAHAQELVQQTALVFVQLVKQRFAELSPDPAKAAAITPTVAVFDPAYTLRGQVDPDPPRDIGIGAGLGLLLGLLGAFLREHLDRRLRSREAVAAAFGLPVLADVRFAGGKRGVPEGDLEALATLRASLQLLALRRPLRTLVVTGVGGDASAGSLAGLVAVGLAAAYARAGSRTILVECDVRRPRLGDSLGLGAGSPGLSDVIAGGELSGALRTAPVAGGHIAVLEPVSLVPLGAGCAVVAARPALLARAGSGTDWTAVGLAAAAAALGGLRLLVVARRSLVAAAAAPAALSRTLLAVLAALVAAAAVGDGAPGRLGWVLAGLVVAAGAVRLRLPVARPEEAEAVEGPTYHLAVREQLLQDREQRVARQREALAAQLEELDRRRTELAALEAGLAVAQAAAVAAPAEVVPLDVVAPEVVLVVAAPAEAPPLAVAEAVAVVAPEQPAEVTVQAVVAPEQPAEVTVEPVVAPEPVVAAAAAQTMEALLVERLERIESRLADVEERERALELREAALAALEASKAAESEPVPEPVPAPEPAATTAPAAEPPRAAAEPEPVAELSQEPTPAPAPAASAPPVRPAPPVARSLAELERLVAARAADFPERADEWRAYLHYLRDFSDVHGRLGPGFDWLIGDIFADLLD